MSGRRQQSCCEEWHARAQRLIDRGRGVGETASPDALSRRRADGGWSAAQVLEHLIVTSTSYLAVMRQHVVAAWGQPEDRSRIWRPRLGGRILVRALVSRRPLPASRGFRPGLGPRPDVVGTFVAEMHEFQAVLERAAPLPWNAIRFGSPVLWLLRLNVGDGFLILLTHAERHFAQIDRVLAEAGT